MAFVAYAEPPTPQTYLHLSSGWHAVATRRPRPDTGEFLPRPKEAIVVDLGTATPKDKLDARAEEARDALKDAFMSRELVTLRRGQVQARFWVRSYDTGYIDRPQSITWTALLLQSEAWQLVPEPAAAQLIPLH